MELSKESYFSDVSEPKRRHDAAQSQQALERCVDRLKVTMPVIGLRNPKIGLPDKSWAYCRTDDWVAGFHSGQLWLAFQLTGDSAYLNSARARRPAFRTILDTRAFQDHDLGFQFSLTSVAEWLMTGDATARAMGLEAANKLAQRYRPEGRYIQAWNPAAKPGGRMTPTFCNGRAIVDTMQNLALLMWAYRETGRADFKEISLGHAQTTLDHLVRPDDTSFHNFVFDPATGLPLRGETLQGHAADSCWSRGQAWLIHGFAQLAVATGDQHWAQASQRLTDKAIELHGDDAVPVWDYSLHHVANAPRDSSAAAIMAAGVYILADVSDSAQATRLRDFGDRLIAGLLATCDLTTDPDALGFLDHGASHVRYGFADNMLPYGDYYFMEALMRSLGHKSFFW